MRARIKKIYPEVDGLLSQMRVAIANKDTDLAMEAHAKLCQHFKKGGEMEPRHFDEMRALYGVAMELKVSQTPELQTPYV